MSTVIEKLEKLKSIKLDIKSALEAKDIEVNNNFTQYASKILDVYDKGQGDKTTELLSFPSTKVMLNDGTTVTKQSIMEADNTEIYLNGYNDGHYKDGAELVYTLEEYDAKEEVFEPFDVKYANENGDTSRINLASGYLGVFYYNNATMEGSLETTPYNDDHCYFSPTGISVYDFLNSGEYIVQNGEGYYNDSMVNLSEYSTQDGSVYIADQDIVGSNYIVPDYTAVVGGTTYNVSEYNGYVYDSNLSSYNTPQTNIDYFAFTSLEASDFLPLSSVGDYAYYDGSIQTGSLSNTGECLYNTGSAIQSFMFVEDTLYKFENGELSQTEMSEDGGESSSGGLVTEMSSPKVFDGTPTGSYMDNFCIIGALLSKDGDTWTIWNTNPDETEYWDPKSDTITTPSTQYGEVIAVCVGRGLWAKIGWSGLTTRLKWVSSNSDVLYTTCHGINIHGNGWESTQHIRTHIDADLTDTIWATLAENEYIPSKYELLEIHNNCCDNNHSADDSDSVGHTFNKNLGKLLSFSPSYEYWSSSLCARGNGSYGSAFVVTFYESYVAYIDKANSSRSVALLHFE